MKDSTLFSFFAIEFLPTHQLFPRIANSSYLVMSLFKDWEVSQREYYEPRIFASQRLAQGWLTTYLKGVRFQRKNKVIYTPVEGRNAADFLIVKLKLIKDSQ